MIKRAVKTIFGGMDLCLFLLVLNILLTFVVVPYLLWQLSLKSRCNCQHTVVESILQGRDERMETTGFLFRTALFSRVATEERSREQREVRQ